MQTSERPRDGSEHDHAHGVATRALSVAATVRASMKSWPSLFRPDALLGLAHVVASSAPDLRDGELVVLAKLGAWICAFDDMVDDSDIADEDIVLRIEQYARLLCDYECPELAFDPVAAMLRDVLDSLTSAPLARSLWPLFVSQFMDSCHAMRWERSTAAMSRNGVATPLQTYLEHAADSICVGFVVTATVMLIGETTALSHVPELLAAQRHSAMVVRIANDLATWPREQHERSAANAMLFVAEASEQVLRDRIETELRLLSCALVKLESNLPLTADFIRRFTDNFVALYRKGDLGDVR